MSSINPFSGYVAQSTQLEQAQAADKTRQIRHSQALSKDVAARDDELEHQVESSDAVASVHDEQNPTDQQKRRQSGKDPNQPDDNEPPRLDVVA